MVYILISPIVYERGLSEMSWQGKGLSKNVTNILGLRLTPDAGKF